MAVFASVFGKLAQRLSPGNIGETIQSHVGLVPNPLSERSKKLEPRIHDARMVKSVCPYCAVGCGQRVYVKDGKVIDIEGDYDSPISGGCLCPKGGASFQLDINERRWTTVKYRAPYSTEWEDRPLDWVMDRVAQLVYETREATFRETNEEDKLINNTLAIGSLRWAMAAKERGATIIHVDPHFSRTSQMADIYAPIRVGTDIAFLGGIINYVLQNELYFKEYVQAYTNAPFIVRDDFRDTEDLEDVFSGLKPDHSAYDTRSWQYKLTKKGESREPTEEPSCRISNTLQSAAGLPGHAQCFA